MAHFRDVGLFLRSSLFQMCRSSFELQSISKPLIYTCGQGLFISHGLLVRQSTSEVESIADAESMGHGLFSLLTRFQPLLCETKKTSFQMMKQYFSPNVSTEFCERNICI